MQDIDRLRELDDQRILDAIDATPEPDQSEDCEICGKQMVFDGSGWIANAEYDRSDDCFVGDTLHDAIVDRKYTVCSKVCLSQAFYNKLDKDDRYHLNAVLDACFVLSESGDKVKRILSQYPEGTTCLMETLVDESEDFLKDMAFHDCPDWANRPTREEMLESSIRKVARKAERLAWWLGDDASYEVNRGRSVLAGLAAWSAAKAAHIHLDLKEALGE